MKTLLNIVIDVVLAPFRVLMDPWAAMHGNVGAALLRLSIAGISALLSFLFILLLTILFVIIRAYDGSDWRAYWETLPWLILCLIAIPPMVYFFVRSWTQEAGERFPDIEQAWNVGIAELRRLGFDLGRTPLYVVIGSESSEKDQHLFKASELKFVIAHFPRGRGQVLRWYASEDAIFVVLSHVGCLTTLARSAAALTASDRSQISVRDVLKPPSAVGVTATVWPAEDESEFLSSDSGVRALPAGAASGGAGNQVSPALTMSVEDSHIMPDSAAAEKPEGQRRAKLQPLTREMSDLEQRRLVYLSRLARETRRPYCAVNGVLVQVPLNLIVTDDSGGAYAKEALLADVTILIKQLGLRFPVLALVTGWEEDLGFLEFMRRFEPDVVRTHRLGKGFGVGDPPLTDQLDALCMHASRQFEDWIYKFFRKPGALAKPGNRALYSLLCKVRRYLVPRLKKIVSDALGCRELEEQDQAVIMVGAYFAAAGAHEDHRAFVKGVFAKLIETNEDLEWTPDAQHANARQYAIGYSSLALGLALVGLSLLWWWWVASRQGF